MTPIPNTPLAADALEQLISGSINAYISPGERQEDGHYPDTMTAEDIQAVKGHLASVLRPHIARLTQEARADELQRHIVNLNYAIGYIAGEGEGPRYLARELELAEDRLAELNVKGDK